MDKENPNSGHRERLRKRFEQNGLSALSEHEIVELLLTYVLRQGDVKPMAKALLAKFSTINGVLNAPVAELETVKGIKKHSAHLIIFIKELMAFCLKEKYSRRSIMTHRGDVEEYLRHSFGLMRDEYVAALFLDNAQHIVSTEIVSQGTVNQCAIYPRIIFGRAIQCGAAAFILAHNHPGGGKKPSEEDWSVTIRLIQTGKLMEIPLLDHIIITSESTISLRELPRWSG
jgi:DNA repair protein RadC